MNDDDDVPPSVQEAKRDHPAAPPAEQPVWTYRGYQMRSAEFNTAMVHFFRAEVSRSGTWRQRLDATTNWAVITTGATISFAFTSRGTEAGVDHGVIILNTLLITVFLLIEARRYRYYELWSSRVRLMETDFYAAMLVPPFQPAPDWAETLAESLLHPKFPISNAEAFGRRFRRNYMLIYLLLGAAWFLKVWLHPTPALSLDEFIARAAIGSVPGWAVVTVGVAFNLVVLAVGWLTLGLQDTAGEVLPRYGQFQLPRFGLPMWLRGRGGVAGRAPSSASGAGSASARAGADRPSGAARPVPADRRAWFRPKARRRSQLLTYTITSMPDAVAQRIMAETGRGVTAIPGRGMYGNTERGVLLCAVTVTEVAHLRDVVKHADPHAFVIVSPVQEVLGEGFIPLADEPEDGSTSQDHAPRDESETTRG